jgi:hypothetical protein
MTLGLEGTARLASSAEVTALCLDRRARTISMRDAVLGAKPWLGV